MSRTVLLMLFTLSTLFLHFCRIVLLLSMSHLSRQLLYISNNSIFTYILQITREAVVLHSSVLNQLAFRYFTCWLLGTITVSVHNLFLVISVAV